MKPVPLFCDDPDVFAAVVAALPVLAGVVAGADADADADALMPLVLSGKPPANAFDALTATAPTTSVFNRWRINCAPQKLYKPKRLSAVNL